MNMARKSNINHHHHWGREDRSESLDMTYGWLHIDLFTVIFSEVYAGYLDRSHGLRRHRVERYSLCAVSEN